MDTLQVNTNLHCDNCVTKLAPHLDNDPTITSWQVDIEHPNKTLTVQGHELSNENINDLLHKEGYEIIDKIVKEDQQTFWANIDTWKRASFNTLNCLIGCSIGDFGMIIFLQAYYPETSMSWQMILAVITGLSTSIALETLILKHREKFNWNLALKTAFGMSFISMVGMEIVMNTTDFIITGGKATFDDPMYWTALMIAMVAGFLAPLPYNYYKLKKFNRACH